jgi:hypothetical protein
MKNIIMVRFIFLSISILVIIACSKAESVLPQGATILSESRAAEVLHQCSRRTINDVDSYWTPTTKDIVTLEHTLHDFLSKSGVVKPSAPLASYYRQYVGVTTHGRRLIYGNFFPKSFVERVGDGWRSEPVNICDGGDNYWGIVYDPKTNKFQPPQYNGEA